MFFALGFAGREGAIQVCPASYNRTAQHSHDRQLDRWHCCRVPGPHAAARGEQL